MTRSWRDRRPPIPRSELWSRLCGRAPGWAHVLEDARDQGKLRLRPIHGDPKVNNVMMDTATGQAVSMVDLDTVKPGLVHYDIGDCLRSGCNPLGEETGDWEAVRFEPDLGRAILQGYSPWPGISSPRTTMPISTMPSVYRLRAGTEVFHRLSGGQVYFKARHPEHNLARALVQFG